MEEHHEHLLEQHPREDGKLASAGRGSPPRAWAFSSFAVCDSDEERGGPPSGLHRTVKNQCRAESLNRRRNGGCLRTENWSLREGKGQLGDARFCAQGIKDTGNPK